MTFKIELKLFMRIMNNSKWNITYRNQERKTTKRLIPWPSEIERTIMFWIIGAREGEKADGIF